MKYPSTPTPEYLIEDISEFPYYLHNRIHDKDNITNNHVIVCQFKQTVQESKYVNVIEGLCKGNKDVYNLFNKYFRDDIDSIESVRFSLSYTLDDSLFVVLDDLSQVNECSEKFIILKIKTLNEPLLDSIASFKQQKSAKWLFVVVNKDSPELSDYPYFLFKNTNNTLSYNIKHKPLFNDDQRVLANCLPEQSFQSYSSDTNVFEESPNVIGSIDINNTKKGYYKFQCQGTNEIVRFWDEYNYFVTYKENLLRGNQIGGRPNARAINLNMVIAKQVLEYDYNHEFLKGKNEDEIAHLISNSLKEFESDETTLRKLFRNIYYIDANCIESFINENLEDFLDAAFFLNIELKKNTEKKLRRAIVDSIPKYLLKSSSTDIYYSDKLKQIRNKLVADGNLINYIIELAIFAKNYKEEKDQKNLLQIIHKNLNKKNNSLNRKGEKATVDDIKRLLEVFGKKLLEEQDSDKPNKDFYALIRLMYLNLIDDSNKGSYSWTYFFKDMCKCYGYIYRNANVPKPCNLKEKTMYFYLKHKNFLLNWGFVDYDQDKDNKY